MGGNGVIRFWDGSISSAQTSGTIENLLDVDFINDNVGWAVGGGWTVLKTVDGGQNWIPQTVPTDIDPYFKGVCFVDSLEGWVAGLSGTVLHTTDSGATWEVQATGTLFSLRRVRSPPPMRVGRWATAGPFFILLTAEPMGEARTAICPPPTFGCSGISWRPSLVRYPANRS